jgi:hypothetical protein
MGCNSVKLEQSLIFLLLYAFDLSGLYSNLVIGRPISISISLTIVTWLPGDTINYNRTYDKFITNISNSLLVIFILEVNHVECLVFVFSWKNPVPTYSFQTIF